MTFQGIKKTAIAAVFGILALNVSGADVLFDEIAELRTVPQPQHQLFPGEVQTGSSASGSLLTLRFDEAEEDAFEHEAFGFFGREVVKGAFGEFDHVPEHSETAVEKGGVIRPCLHNDRFVTGVKAVLNGADFFEDGLFVEQREIKVLNIHGLTSDKKENEEGDGAGEETYARNESGVADLFFRVSASAKDERQFVIHGITSKLHAEKFGKGFFGELLNMTENHRTDFTVPEVIFGEFNGRFLNECFNAPVDKRFKGFRVVVKRGFEVNNQSCRNSGADVRKGVSHQLFQRCAFNRFGFFGEPLGNVADSLSFADLPCPDSSPEIGGLGLGTHGLSLLYPETKKAFEFGAETPSRQHHLLRFSSKAKFPDIFCFMVDSNNQDIKKPILTPSRSGSPLIDTAIAISVAMESTISPAERMSSEELKIIGKIRTSQLITLNTEA